MTHYYLYIRAGVTLNTETKFYKVSIGESLRETRIRTWLMAYAAEHGHLFTIWSEGTAEFLTKCWSSIGVDRMLLIHVSGSQLQKYLRVGVDDPVCLQGLQHQHYLLMQIDSDYYIAHEIAKRKSKKQ